jgi:hypothetical protein
MNKIFLPLIALGLLVSIIFLSSYLSQQQPETWTKDQLLEPSALAKTINNPKEQQPFIVCVGPGAVIPGSVDIGPTKEKTNQDKLKAFLNKLHNDASIVIYCGCCPFDHCPNVRPAFAILNEMKFSRAKLLNLTHNIRTDWIDKGFPQKK